LALMGILSMQEEGRDGRQAVAALSATKRWRAAGRKAA